MAHFKKLVFLILIGALVISLTSCKMPWQKTKSDDNSTTTTETSTPTTPTTTTSTNFTVTINVVNSSNGGISGATVRIGSSTTLTTDSSGNASATISSGTYTITVTKSGYNDYSGSYSLSGTTTIKITMTTAPTTTTTSTGSSTGEAYSSSPYSGSWRYVSDTSNGGQLYDTYRFNSSTYIKLDVTQASGDVRVQILNNDFTHWNLSESQVESELPSRLVWERTVSAPTVLYPKGVPPGSYYINLYKGSGVLYAYTAP